MNLDLPKTKAYEAPRLESHQFLAVTGISIPIGSNGADPFGDFMDTTQDFLNTEEQ